MANELTESERGSVQKAEREIEAEVLKVEEPKAKQSESQSDRGKAQDEKKTWLS